VSSYAPANFHCLLFPQKCQIRSHLLDWPILINFKPRTRRLGYVSVYSIIHTKELSRLTYGDSYGDQTWTECKGLMNKPQQSPKKRTQPKPDHTYAFPIQDTSRNDLKGFARDVSTQTLSLQVLGNLVKQGVSCASTTGLRKWIEAPDKTILSSHDKSCFPWAVVEFKKHATAPGSSDKERCYCQAANAAAAALELQDQLFDKVGSDASLQLPPVIAFTCVGPIVKVWLAYQDEACPTRKKQQVGGGLPLLGLDANN
jgi:hypothetical protein